MSNSEKTFEPIPEIVRETILESLSQDIRKHNEFFKRATDLIKDTAAVDPNFSKSDPETKKAVLEHALKTKNQILSLVTDTFYSDIDEVESEYRIREFKNRIDEWLKEFPIRQIEFQKKERFYSSPEDSVFVRILKFYKRFTYKIFVLPQILGNTFRKLRGKKSKQYHYWRHSIPERSMNSWFYKLLTIEKLQPIGEKVDAEILDQMYSVFKAYEFFDQKLIHFCLSNEEAGKNSETREGVTNQQDKDLADKVDSSSVQVVKKGYDPVGFPATLEEDTQSIYKNISESFNNARGKVGTWELPGFRFSQSRLSNREKQVYKNYVNSAGNWHNAHRMVLEDWRLNVELYKAIYSDLILHQELKLVLNSKVQDLDAGLTEIFNYLDEVKKGISKKYSNASELKAFVLETRYDCKKNFRGHKITNLANSLISQNFPGLLNRLEASIRSIINNLPSESKVYKEPVVEGPVEESAIYKISPSELILFESFGSFENSLKKGKLDLLKKSEETKVIIESVGDIVEYSLNSALEIINDESKENPEAISLIQESLDRANTKVKEIKSQIEEMGRLYAELTESSLRDFNIKLNDLTNNENIYDLRFRLTKARAVATTSALRTRAFEKLRSGAEKAISYGFNFLKPLGEKIKKLTGRFSKRILTAPISTNVSDFLAESENKIQRLPFVYQKLFSLEPVTDKNMFAARDDELQLLNKAFSKWEQGKYAATIVLGEKGAGITSLVNAFIDFRKKPYATTKIRPDSRIHNETELLQLLSLLLKKEFKTVNEAIDFLNGYEKKRIFILEDLQKFFLRTVGGFQSLKIIQKIITSTNDNIFWIVNTNRYTWEYLHNAIRIGEFFEYQIDLSDMKLEHVTDIISSRNKISGYSIRFVIPDDEKADKKLKKYSEEEIQLIYAERFFNSLNRFTKSNITLSLLYWQLSIHEVTDDTIYMDVFQPPDLSFISSLDKTKVFVLQACLIHDGLGTEELGDVIGVSEDQSHLILLSLYEDGILMKRDESFIVNPLIYRQTINLLKSQNLLT